MNAKSFDVLVVGIGGQGTILSSNILGEACIEEGKTVRGAETHGMAQRGGSVESHIRIGGVYGPLIAPGSADLLISFDLLEALRYRHFLGTKGKMVVNYQLVVPTSVFLQGLPVPNAEDILKQLLPCHPCVIHADKIALDAGSPLVQNVVVLGAASHFLPLSIKSLRSAVAKLVPPKTVELNLKAFEMGRKSGKPCRGGDTAE